MGDPANAIRLVTSDHRRQSSEESLRKWKILIDVPSQILRQVKTASVGTCWYGMVGFLITYSDQVYVVGNNNIMLGLPDDSATTRIQRNPALSGLQIQEFYTGWDFVAARTIRGEVLTWGQNEDGQLGSSSSSNAAATAVPHKVQGALENQKIQKISVGYHHCLCLTNCGKVISWGRSSQGQLGRPLKSTTIPQEVEFPQPVEIANVFCTACSSFALTIDGELYAWGWNSNGELGDGTHESRSEPQIVKFPGNVKISKVACGYDHVLTLSTGGALFAWGRKQVGQLGVNSTTKVLIPTRVDSVQERIIDIASVPYVSADVSACKTESKVYVWGNINATNILVPKETSFATIADAFASYGKGMPDNETWHSDENNPVKPEADLKSLFEDPANNNVAFKVDGQKVLGYKFLLERCAAFKIKFAGEWKDHSVSNPIQITDSKYPEFKAFVKFLHSDEIDIPQEHMIALLRLAQKYDMKLLKYKVVDILGKRITPTNAIKLYRAAFECEVTDLWTIALEFIGPRFTSILKETEDFDVFPQLLRDLKTLNIDFK